MIQTQSDEIENLKVAVRLRPLTMNSDHESNLMIENVTYNLERNTKIFLWRKTLYLNF